MSASESHCFQRRQDSFIPSIDLSFQTFFNTRQKNYELDDSPETEYLALTVAQPQRVELSG